MKIIYKIARTELRTLFLSPIAWVVIVVFFVVSAAEFVSPLMNMARVQEVKTKFSPDWSGFKGPLTLELFYSSISRFLTYFYLFLPLLTMGVMSREVNAGTIKLLYSSPIRIIDLVLGKYLGLLLFNLVLLAAIALLLTTGYYTILHAEFYWYLSMLLGFFLLSATYTAIGLFISCLTNYQLVAGISTFVVFFILGMVGSLFQDVDVARDITYFLSLSGRTESMIMGLITTRDILYFLLIIVLFLGLAIIKLKSTQESKKWTVQFSRNLGLVIVILTLGYFSSKPGYVGYCDVTREQLNTIDSSTQKVLQEMDGSPLTVTLYTNLLGLNVDYGVHRSRNNYVWKFWDQYVRFYPNIHLKYEYYYDIKPGDSSIYNIFPGKDIHGIAAQKAKLLKVDVKDYKKPGEIDKLVDLSGEDLRLIMEAEYKGKKTFLRTFAGNGSTFPAEPVVAGAVKRLIKDSTPLVLFTTGHYERSPYRNGEREYGNHTNDKRSNFALINLGVNVDTIGLLNNTIPIHTTLLAVADPKSSLSEKEQEQINQYLEAGGNALFYGEPGKQDKLNPILNKIGVNMEDGILVRPAMHTMPEYFHFMVTPESNYMANEVMMQIYQRIGGEGASAYFASVSTLSFHEANGFKIEPIVKERSNEFPTWIEKGVFVADSANPTFSALEGDVKKEEYIIGVKLTRMLNNKEQRIIVMADADFMTPNRLDGSFIGNAFYSWLLYNKYPLYTRFVMHQDTRLTIGKKSGILIYNLYVYAIPGLLLLLGSIILVRRKRK